MKEENTKRTNRNLFPYISKWGFGVCINQIIAWLSYASV